MHVSGQVVAIPGLVVVADGPGLPTPSPRRVAQRGGPPRPGESGGPASGRSASGHTGRRRGRSGVATATTTARSTSTQPRSPRWSNFRVWGRCLQSGFSHSVTRTGSFSTVEDLLDVAGIGEAKLACACVTRWRCPERAQPATRDGCPHRGDRCRDVAGCPPGRGRRKHRSRWDCLRVGSRWALLTERSAAAGHVWSASGRCREGLPRNVVRQL